MTSQTGKPFLSKGYTLIELLVILGILILSLTVIVPRMSTFIEKKQASLLWDGLEQSLLEARSYAINHQKTVLLNYDPVHKSYVFSTSNPSAPAQMESIVAPWAQEKIIPSYLSLKISTQTPVQINPDGTMSKSRIKLLYETQVFQDKTLANIFTTAD